MELSPQSKQDFDTIIQRQREQSDNNFALMISNQELIVDMYSAIMNTQQELENKFYNKLGEMSQSGEVTEFKTIMKNREKLDREVSQLLLDQQQLNEEFPKIMEIQERQMTNQERQAVEQPNASQTMEQPPLESPENKKERLEKEKEAREKYFRDNKMENIIHKSDLSTKCKSVECCICLDDYEQDNLLYWYHFDLNGEACPHTSHVDCNKITSTLLDKQIIKCPMCDNEEIVSDKVFKYDETEQVANANPVVETEQVANANPVVETEQDANANPVDENEQVGGTRKTKKQRQKRKRSCKKQNNMMCQTKPKSKKTLKKRNN
jgi:hypothetical protein